MFQAGVVAPSSCFLLQLLTFPGGDVCNPPFDVSEDLEGLDLPPRKPAVVELPALELLVPLARVLTPLFPL